VQWPDDVTGLNGQVVLAILDGSGAVIARTAAIGPLTTAGSSFPAGVSAGPACKALPDLSGPYLAEISRAITFN
jgi:hypothetical protein